VADLTLAGLVEAHYWQTDLPWTASIVAVRKYWWVRLISAVPIVLDLSVSASESSPGH